MNLYNKSTTELQLKTNNISKESTNKLFIIIKK
jgi:hypothetical protein